MKSGFLKSSYSGVYPEAGCDEAGRGCLAGPVVAAAVIFPQGYDNPLLNDSKKLSIPIREKLSEQIKNDAVTYAYGIVDNNEIDRINILNASFKAMHLALAGLTITPQLILIDGNRFKPFGDIQHKCIIKGDGLYQAIAGASILAKTYRDMLMIQLHNQYPEYEWAQNKGYPTIKHRKVIISKGFTEFHRRSFNVQLNIF
jgi:ribonuclease HII